MIDKPITSDLARLLYNVYKVNYLTCLTIQEMEEKAKKYDELVKAANTPQGAIRSGKTSRLFLDCKELQEAQILKDGIKVLLDDLGIIENKHCDEIDDCPAFDFFTFSCDDKGFLDIDSICEDDDGCYKPNEQYAKFKAMLEVVENE